VDENVKKLDRLSEALKQWIDAGDEILLYIVQTKIPGQAPGTASSTTGMHD
jgi:hypothetical protein